MVVLRINNADLPVGWTHDATDWQVSTSQDFSNILVESLNDSSNLTVIVFDENLELGVKYYARARMLLNNGFTEWSNIDIFTPEDVDEVSMLSDIPSIITTPTLVSRFDLNAHPGRYFNIDVENGFSTLGNANHESTSWLIEDNTGKPIWSSIDDKENLLSLNVDMELPINKVYHIHASLKGSNGDTSQFGTITFYTSDDGNFLISRYLYRNEDDLDLEIDHPFINGLDYLEWELYTNGVLVTSGNTVDSFFTVEKEFLGTNDIDIIKVRTEINSKINDWSYIYVITGRNGIEEDIGTNIPYLNGNDDGFVSFPLPFPHKF